MSSLIKEGKNFLTKEHKKTIQKLLEQNQLSFYMGPAFEQGTNYPYLSHTVLKRPEDRTADDMTYPSKYTKENQFNSIHADIFLEILFAFCDKYKIKINKVFRINVNLTFNIGTKKCPSHVDHEFDHKQLIIYLNDCDKDAKTIMLDENNKISHEITPEKYKGVLFDNCKHYLIYPKKGARIIAIYTFD
jgi:hypothetical protein|tara:strand:+ start:4997 stop:5563 length:567 start_codon:yes stop_codon:yes gene_type:complete